MIIDHDPDARNKDDVEDMHTPCNHCLHSLPRTWNLNKFKNLHCLVIFLFLSETIQLLSYFGIRMMEKIKSFTLPKTKHGSRYHDGEYLTLAWPPCC